MQGDRVSVIFGLDDQVRRRQRRKGKYDRDFAQVRIRRLQIFDPRRQKFLGKYLGEASKGLPRSGLQVSTMRPQRHKQGWELWMERSIQLGCF